MDSAQHALEAASHVQEFGADTLTGRPAQPEELAPARVLLASNIEPRYISGDILGLRGGETIAG